MTSIITVANASIFQGSITKSDFCVVRDTPSAITPPNIKEIIEVVAPPPITDVATTISSVVTTDAVVVVQ